jgi:hypothetical protein
LDNISLLAKEPLILEICPGLVLSKGFNGIESRINFLYVDMAATFA